MLIWSGIPIIEVMPLATEEDGSQAPDLPANQFQAQAPRRAAGKRGEERAEKNKWLRVASLTWNADTQIVRHLSRRGIVLARSDLGAVDSPRLREDYVAGPDWQFHWTTNVLR
ncbi:hypothetical protein VTI28DRAFT_1240 [Corynascus sepedonium]